MVNAEILTILILDSIFFIFATIAFFNSIKIFLYWDQNSTSSFQYKLEKISFLNQTLIKYIFVLKIPLFLFFIFTLDKISNVITGAMCAAGVINATEIGVFLILLKIANIYFFGLWLILNYIDLKKEDLPFTKIKFGIFIFLYFFLVLEIFLDFYMFFSLNPAKLVSCCGTIFSSNSSSAISTIFNIKTSILLTLFYGSYILMLFFKNNQAFFLFLNIFYLVIAIISLIIFFSTYVYELPTHHCPFCLLQKDYFYIGYLFYIFLFLGTFFGIAASIFKIKKYIKLSLIFNFLYLFLVSLYPIVFYIKNSVFL